MEEGWGDAPEEAREEGWRVIPYDLRARGKVSKTHVLGCIWGCVGDTVLSGRPGVAVSRSVEVVMELRMSGRCKLSFCAAVACRMTGELREWFGNMISG